MEKRIASRILLLMLSLQALLLVVAGLPAPAAATVAVAGVSGEDMGGAIRLPSGTASAGERPWKCCDLQPCTRSIPAICRCRDQLERCSDACKECAKVGDSDPPRYVCEDVYTGDPAPMCHENQGRNQVVVAHAGPKEMAAVVRGSKKGENGKGRPWKCCDKAVPGPTTTEGKAVWYCMDKVDKCTCNRCFELEGSHRYYYCLDGYQGRDPGPS